MLALVVDEAERSAAEGDDPAEAADEVDLGAGELGLGAGDDEHAAVVLAGLGAERRRRLLARGRIELRRPDGDRAHLGDVERVRLGPGRRRPARCARRARRRRRRAPRRRARRGGSVADRSSSNELTSVRKSESWRVAQPSDRGSCGVSRHARVSRIAALCVLKRHPSHEALSYKPAQADKSRMRQA